MNIDSNLTGRVVNFAVRPAALLGSNFVNVKILDILSPVTAAVFADIQALHLNVMSTLPDGYRDPQAYNAYSYVRVQYANGEYGILGIPWIDESTVVIVENLTGVVTIPNIGSTDVARIRQALVGAGYSNVTITLQ